MRTIFFILRKEFKQIFRAKEMKLIIFAMPLIQLLIIGHAATYEIKQINFFVLDYDRSAVSKEIVNKFVANNYFHYVGTSEDPQVADDYLTQGKIDLIIRMNNDFEKNIVNQQNPKMLFTVNAVDGYTAGIVNSYAQAILNDYKTQLILQQGQAINQQPSMIDITFLNWFNPTQEYSTFMVPGILVILVSMIGLFLTSLNIAREKEIGTIEQLNVTPIKKYQFIIGKLAPMLIIGLFELYFGLLIAKIGFSIPFVGSLWVIFVFAILYLIIMLSIGLFISTIANNQQQAMFIGFLIVIVYIFLSGLFTPITSMPIWAQYLSKLVPLSYFIQVMRNVLLKGSGFMDMFSQFIALLIMGIVTVNLAIFKYRKSAK